MILPFLWEFSHIYGNLKKAFPLFKDIVFNNKWEISHFFRNYPNFMGIFPFLEEFEESLPSLQRLRVKQ